ncbi:MAG: hypothetical protein F6K36_31105, partial [Symploca sp. SIO3C6]|nr:hypothetical protein [Symploca sp. SIO3C6]
MTLWAIRETAAEARRALRRSILLAALVVLAGIVLFAAERWRFLSALRTIDTVYYEASATVDKLTHIRKSLVRIPEDANPLFSSRQLREYTALQNDFFHTLTVLQFAAPEELKRDVRGGILPAAKKLTNMEREIITTA